MRPQPLSVAMATRNSSLFLPFPQQNPPERISRVESALIGCYKHVNRCYKRVYKTAEVWSNSSRQRGLSNQRPYFFYINKMYKYSNSSTY